MVILSSIVTCALLAVLTTSFPTGPPERACYTMTPGHGYTSQTYESSPYNITYTEQVVGEDTQYNVVLEANSGYFKGFLIQAREPGTDNIIGTFTFTGSNIIHLNCDGEDNAVSHNSPSEKTKVEVTWKPSSGYTGDVVFLASIVRRYSEYWVKQESLTFAIL